jgi:hypothetical protein
MIFGGLLFATVGAVFFHGTLLWLVPVAVGAFMAEVRIGTPTVAVEPAVVRAGETASVGFTTTPTRRLRLNRLWAELVAEEVAVSGSGTNKTTHRFVLCRERQDFPGEFPLAAAPGKPLSLSQAFALPRSAAPTFSAKDNEITWSIVVYADIEGWPDWSEAYALTVVPS